MNKRICLSMVNIKNNFMQVVLNLLLGLLLFTGCEQAGNDQQQAGEKVKMDANFDKQGLDSAYFASGCFWCVESIYEHVKGVPEAISGYAGGEKVNPSYREVASGGTEHAETVKVYYNPDKITFKELVEIYYGSQDPTTVGQDPDFGSQYRSIIFYQNEQERKIAEAKKAEVAKNYEKEVVTAIKELDAFYPAKAYHQDYERKNPNKGYIQQVSKPRLKEFKQRFPEYIEKEEPWKP
jgi:peptide-methionine (S)-S-oxide reductase